MAWRLSRAVVRGEIDNTRKGIVSGKIWLCGRKEPIALNLRGNCWKDIAGCKIIFSNPNPHLNKEDTDLNAIQNGKAGDMTASRKVRVLDVSLQEAIEMKEKGLTPPEHKGNCLYLEWFSDFNGRVVIESADYELQVSEHLWNATSEEEKKTAEDNAKSICEWMTNLGEATTPPSAEPQEDEQEYEEDEDLDEWDWESCMRDMDAGIEQLAALFKQYEGHPDLLEIVENEMGWDLDPDWIEELEEEIEDYWDAIPDPDPAAEGKEWVRDSEGRIEHPLVKETDENIEMFIEKCDQAGLIADPSDDIAEMFTESKFMMFKMSAVLTNIAQGLMMHRSLVVASLKRALKHFDRSMAASERLLQTSFRGRKQIEEFRKFMFDTRMAILDMMENYRRNVK